jgi:hypothetical protein
MTTTFKVKVVNIDNESDDVRVLINDNVHVLTFDSMSYVSAYEVAEFVQDILNDIMKVNSK